MLNLPTGPISDQVFRWIYDIGKQQNNPGRPDSPPHWAEEILNGSLEEENIEFPGEQIQLKDGTSVPQKAVIITNTFLQTVPQSSVVLLFLKLHKIPSPLVNKETPALVVHFFMTVEAAIAPNDILNYEQTHQRKVMNKIHKIVEKILDNAIIPTDSLENYQVVNPSTHLPFCANLINSADKK